MSEPLLRPEREAQALREVGRTEIASAARLLASVAFALTIAVVPALDLAGGSRDLFGRLAGELGAAAASARQDGPLGANRRALAALAAFEDSLEERSLLRGRLLPPVQSVMTRFLGLGNEQAYPGRQGWLFYRPDFDYVAGPPFLASETLERRERGGDPWRDPEAPDPLPALLELDRQLATRGIRLLLLPVPVKPILHPEPLSHRLERGSSALHNPSYDVFVRRAEAGGLTLFDPTELLLELARAEGEPVFLRTDTHWTPGAVDRVASSLAERLRPWLAATVSADWYRRPVWIEGEGDIARMLRLDAGAFGGRQRVQVEVVFDADGRPWQPRSEAELLLLGDSFSNVYSDPSLGWGGGAGLGEQLSYHLGAPLDRIAVNAGGALGARRALAREAAAGRLAGKSVVVYQFAVRELAQGDWRRIALPPG